MCRPITTLYAKKHNVFEIIMSFFSGKRHYFGRNLYIAMTFVVYELMYETTLLLKQNGFEALMKKLLGSTKIILISGSGEVEGRRDKCLIVRPERRKL